MAERKIIERDRYIGRRIFGSPIPYEEIEHFMQCNECGAFFDMRDLGDVFAHEGPHDKPKGDS